MLKIIFLIVIVIGFIAYTGIDDNFIRLGIKAVKKIAGRIW